VPCGIPTCSSEPASMRSARKVAIDNLPTLNGELAHFRAGSITHFSRMSQFVIEDPVLDGVHRDRFSCKEVKASCEQRSAAALEST
jgi:hypothetical protein